MCHLNLIIIDHNATYNIVCSCYYFYGQLWKIYKYVIFYTYGLTMEVVVNVRCYTVRDNQVYFGINGSVLNIDSSEPIYIANMSMVKPVGLPENTDIDNLPWETEYIFSPGVDNAISRGGIVHICLDDWIPCTDLGDNSILLESFNDGTGLLFMPKMSCILKGNSNGLFLVSGNSGRPEIGIAGPTGVLRRTRYKGVEKKPRLPNIPVSPEISALVASLKTYRDSALPLSSPLEQA